VKTQNLFPGCHVSSPSEKSTVLIVDDTPANLTLLSEILKSDHRTKVALSGEKALKLAFANPPDLILLDIMMPGMDGYEVCRKLKMNPATQGVPVIFVTAMNEIEDEAKGLECGAVDYLVKPISAAIVKARVKTHLLLHAQAKAMERMISALQSQAAELSEFNRTLEHRVSEGVSQVERLGRLKRFFSPSVVDLLLSGPDDPLKIHRRQVAAVFLDMRGYTAFTETSDPEDVMRIIGEYHAAMGAIVMKHGGTIERFAGDGIMIFFNDPVEIDNPAAVAVQMSIEMQERFETLAQQWKKQGYNLAMGIGIAQGYATIGGIGFDGRRDYGVIGTVTNVASRLCAEAVGGQTLISQRVYAQVADLIQAQPVGELNLKGLHRPVLAYSVTGRRQVPASHSLVDDTADPRQSPSSAHP
jgi:class 3 adenylate cyclase